MTEVWWHYSEIPRDPNEEPEFPSWAEQVNSHLKKMREALSILPTNLWSGLHIPVERSHTRTGRTKLPPIKDGAINPTTFDNWFNEYTVPVRDSQINITRRPYRR